MNPIKATIKQIINHFGIEIIRSPKTNISGIYSYRPVRPHATYSPWIKDKLFQEMIHKIEGYTLVDNYRCFELWKLVEQSAKLQHGSILEIGVWRWGTGVLIAEQARNCGISEKVFLCDTFVGV